MKDTNTNKLRIALDKVDETYAKFLSQKHEFSKAQQELDDIRASIVEEFHEFAKDVQNGIYPVLHEENDDYGVYVEIYWYGGESPLPPILEAEVGKNGYALIARVREGNGYTYFSKTHLDKMNIGGDLQDIIIDEALDNGMSGEDVLQATLGENTKEILKPKTDLDFTIKSFFDNMRKKRERRKELVNTPSEPIPFIVESNPKAYGEVYEFTDIPVAVTIYENIQQSLGRTPQSIELAPYIADKLEVEFDMKKAVLCITNNDDHAKHTDEDHSSIVVERMKGSGDDGFLLYLYDGRYSIPYMLFNPTTPHGENTDVGGDFISTLLRQMNEQTNKHIENLFSLTDSIFDGRTLDEQCLCLDFAKSIGHKFKDLARI